MNKLLVQDIRNSLLVAVALVCLGFAGWKFMKFLCEDVPCHVERP